MYQAGRHLFGCLVCPGPRPGEAVRERRLWAHYCLLLPPLVYHLCRHRKLQGSAGMVSAPLVIFARAIALQEQIIMYTCRLNMQECIQYTAV